MTNKIIKSKSIEEIVLQEYYKNNEITKVTRPIDVANKYKDKRKFKQNKEKNIFYNSYLDYQKYDIEHYSYSTFKVILLYIIQEIINQIFIKRRSWFIRHIGYIDLKLKKYKRPNKLDNSSYSILNDKCIIPRLELDIGIGTNKYIKRYKFELSKVLRQYIKNEYNNYYKSFSYEKFNIKETLR